MNYVTTIFVDTRDDDRNVLSFDLPAEGYTISVLASGNDSMGWTYTVIDHINNHLFMAAANSEEEAVKHWLDWREGCVAVWQYNYEAECWEEMENAKWASDLVTLRTQRDLWEIDEE